MECTETNRIKEYNETFSEWIHNIMKKKRESKRKKT